MIPWTPGLPLAAPVYLDANVLVGGLVNRHRLYPSAARLFGDLLSAGTPIVVSEIGVSESFWALAKIAYCDLAHQPYTAHWTKAIYKRHHSKIFTTQLAKVSAVRGWVRSLDSAGHPIDVVRATKPDWLAGLDKSITFMKDFALTPHDAVHLALAELHARTFITADSDFNAVTGPGAPPGLGLVHLT